MGDPNTLLLLAALNVLLPLFDQFRIARAAVEFAAMVVAQGRLSGGQRQRSVFQIAALHSVTQYWRTGTSA